MTVVSRTIYTLHSLAKYYLEYKTPLLNFKETSINLDQFVEIQIYDHVEENVNAIQSLLNHHAMKYNLLIFYVCRSFLQPASYCKSFKT
jgi:hypothetical protein